MRKKKKSLDDELREIITKHHDNSKDNSNFAISSHLSEQEIQTREMENELENFVYENNYSLSLFNLFTQRYIQIEQITVETVIRELTRILDRAIYVSPI